MAIIAIMSFTSSTLRLRSGWTLTRPPFLQVALNEIIGFFGAVAAWFIAVKRQFFKPRVFRNAIHEFPRRFNLIGADKQALVAFYKIQKQALVRAGNFALKGAAVAEFKIGLVEFNAKTRNFVVNLQMHALVGLDLKSQNVRGAALEQTADRLAEMDGNLGQLFRKLFAGP